MVTPHTYTHACTHNNCACLWGTINISAHIFCVMITWRTGGSVSLDISHLSEARRVQDHHHPTHTLSILEYTVHSLSSITILLEYRAEEGIPLLSCYLCSSALLPPCFPSYGSHTSLYLRDQLVNITHKWEYTVFVAWLISLNTMVSMLACFFLFSKNICICFILLFACVCAVIHMEVRGQLFRDHFFPSTMFLKQDTMVWIKMPWAIIAKAMGCSS